MCRTKIFKLKNISRGKSKNVVFDENDNPSPPTLQITPNLCHTKKRWETVIYFSLIFPFSKERKKVEVTLFIKYYIEPELGFDCHGEIAVVFGAELDAVVLRF